MSSLIRPTSFSFAGLLVLALATGCGVGPVTVAPAGSMIRGHVHGGQQPVSGAAIQLYAVGTTGDGSASTALIQPTVLTDAGGNFNITGDYTCPAGAEVYLVATGGNPGLSLGSNNAQLTLTAALGPCSGLTPSTFIFVNELTTVAAAYALAPYYSSPSAIGSGTSDASALQAAFVYANQLVDTSTGSSPGVNLPTGFTAPVAQLNTIADILSTCVNSTGGLAGDGSVCGTMFNLTTLSGSNPPANTLSAVVNLAINPALNTPALYNMSSTSPPFLPNDTTPPFAFYVELTPIGAPSLTFSQNSVAFPAITATFSNPPMAVTVTNAGTATAVFGSSSITGTNASDFSLTTDTCYNLAPGSSCLLVLGNTPAALGSGTAMLNVPSNATGSPQSVSLSETGATSPGGTVALSATSLTWTWAGPLQDLTITNTSAVPVHFMSFTTSYSSGSNTCGTVLAAGSTCTVSLTLPYNSFDGVLTIKDDASTGSGTQTVQLINYGATGNVSLSRGSTSDTLSGETYLLSNQNPHLNNYVEWQGTLAGPDYVPYLMGETCSGAAFYPTDPTCSTTFQLPATITGTDTLQGPSGYFVVATAPAAAAFTVTPGSSFPGTSPVPSPFSYSGAETFTIQNTGTGTIRPSAGLSTQYSSYFSEFDNCSTLAPGATCTVTITASIPAVTTTTYAAQLVVADVNSGVVGGANASLTTTLPTPAVSTNTYDFPGETTVGSSSMTSFTYYGQSGDATVVTFQSGTNPAGAFSLGGTVNCPGTATASAPCTVNVTFTPPGAAVYTAYVLVTDTVSGVSQSIYLYGQGAFPGNLVANPTSVSFGTVGLNSGTASMLITLTNSAVSSTYIYFSNFTIANNDGSFTYALENTNTCSVLFNGNTPCTLNVYLSPNAKGTHSANLTITNTSGNAPTLVIPLSATVQ